MQNAVAGHGDSEMVIFHFLAVLELEHKIYVIAFLHLDGDHIAVLVKSIDRNGRVIHLLGETGQMQTHDLIDTLHRIVDIALQQLVVYCQVLSI